MISRTSVSRFKDTQIPIPEIARELGVATIMEGAVQRAGNPVRINVQLIDAKTDEHLWAEIFDRELTTENLFAIQSEISQKIAQALKATLSVEEKQRVNEQPTDNLAAYSAYQRGRQLMSRRTAETIDKALLEFQRAVELDPNFALAWVGVSESAFLALEFSDMKRPETFRLLERPVKRPSPSMISWAKHTWRGPNYFHISGGPKQTPNLPTNLPSNSARDMRWPGSGTQGL